MSYYLRVLKNTTKLPNPTLVMSISINVSKTIRMIYLTEYIYIIIYINNIIKMVSYG